MKNKIQINIKTLFGIFLIFFTLFANIIYAQGYGESFQFYYLLWICNLSGFLMGVAFISNKNEVIMSFIPWSFFPFSEFIFDFWNVVSMPEWAIIAGTLGFVISILFFVKEKFFNFRALLFGIFLAIAYISFTNNVFGINYPPEHPETKIPLILGILSIASCLFVIFYNKITFRKIQRI